MKEFLKKFYSWVAAFIATLIPPFTVVGIISLFFELSYHDVVQTVEFAALYGLYAALMLLVTLKVASEQEW